MDDFVCLGWGSLIWCQKTLPVSGTWQADGPDLPLEFVRESRDRRITLVICEGAPTVTTLWARLDVSSVDAAKQALIAREGPQPKGIGWWSPDGASKHYGVEVIGEWAKARGIDGVVWTALKPKIGDEYRTPAQGEVIAHLSGLQGLEREAAEEYVRLAPRQIVTPYRSEIEASLGWTATGLV
ncbi:hypothetical protein GOL99_17845 [Sinorhizobium medicae]|nr:hypothetical protein [Sinorhizobium medicae]